ncbi:MAG: rhodanese-like domain-containing protein [Myxococcota bacterium]|nr:rhodanese-like domain-containing protein [Myxococcota bacterium]
MIGRLLNLPIRALSRAAKVVGDREHAALKAKHGEGDVTGTFQDMKVFDNLDLPEDFEPSSIQVDASQILQELAAQTTVYFIDVRAEERFAEGHIEGAESMPLAEITIRLAELPPLTRVVAYCDEGDDALRAACFLRDRGLEETWALLDGLKGWSEAGGSLVTN